MTQNELLNAYKEAKNYIQDKQIAHDLGLAKQRINEMRKGKRYLTETEVIFLSNTIGIPAEEALIYIAAEKSKSFEAQQLWMNIAKKFERQGLQTFSVLLGAFSSGSLLLNTSTTECVLCTLC